MFAYINLIKNARIVLLRLTKVCCQTCRIKKLVSLKTAEKERETMAGSSNVQSVRIAIMVI